MIDEREYWSTRTCVVTGAIGGQGYAEVGLLRALGASVVAVDVAPSSEERWDAVRSLGSTDELAIVSGDVSHEATWDRIADIVESFGRPLAGLVNNAGITLRRTVSETSTEDWDRIVAVNLSSAFLGIRRLAPIMRHGGSIVNVSSVAGHTGYFAAGYTVTKYGVRGLAKAAAIEFAPQQVRVNVLSPGLVDSPMALNPQPGTDGHQMQGWYRANRQLTPMGRGAQPRELAEAALFLLGPRASFITGADLVVDGGMIGAGLYTHVGRAAGIIPEGSE